MNSKILKFLDKFRRLFEKMGVEYPIMREILSLKLLMDGRRIPTIMNGNKKNNGEDNGNQFLKSLWIYVLFGLVMIPFVVMKHNYAFQMSFVFGMIMFFVITSLISDFSSVLLDIRDKNILGTKPVKQKTISMAKTMHVMIYMFFLSISLAGPALIVSLFIQGPVFFLMFLLLLILMDMFCIILTTIVYFGVLKFFDGEKLKDMINYIQIILSIAITVGYQLIGRVFNLVDIKVDFVPHWWQYLIIPVWFAAPFELVQKWDFNRYYVIFSVLSIAVPVLSLLIYIRLMPQFEKNLQKLNHLYESKKQKSHKLQRLLPRILCQNREERIFFRFALDLMKNERTFKLKVYPNLGFSFVFPFIFLLQSIRDSGLQEISHGKTYLVIYFCGIMLPSLVMMMRYSESYKAAWIYKVVPMSDYKPVFQGTVKAFFVRLFVPVYLLVAVIFTAIYGIRIVPDLMLVVLNMLLFTILSFLLMEKALPFSASFDAMEKTNIGVVFLLLFLNAAIAGAHYLFTLFRFGVFIGLCLSIIICIILWEAAYKLAPGKLYQKD